MKHFFPHAAITFSVAAFIITLSIVTQGSSIAAPAVEDAQPIVTPVPQYSIDKTNIKRNSWTKIGESEYAPHNIRVDRNFLIIGTSDNN